MAFICKDCIHSFTWSEPYMYKDNSKYVGERLGGSLSCPLCRGVDSFVEIDDLLVEPIKELWRLGMKTVYCCSGHSHSDVNNSYIVFVEDSYDKLNKFRDYVMGIKLDIIKVKTIIYFEGCYRLSIRSIEGFDWDYRHEDLNQCSVNFVNFIWKIIRGLGFEIPQ